METYKSFMMGVTIAAAVGYYMYNGVKADNEYLRTMIREQKVERTNKDMETLEFLMRVSETEKDNIKHYDEIVDTTKKYSKVIFEDVKKGEYENIRELVMMHRKLEFCSDQIYANNKQLFESIKKYVTPVTKNSNTKEF